MKNFLPAFLWFIVITVLSLLPGNSIPDFSWADLAGFDKVAHLSVYAILMILIGFGAKQQKIEEKYTPKLIYLLAGYGILIELLQNMMYLGRRFEFLDIIANIIGLILGYIVARRVLIN